MHVGPRRRIVQQVMGECLSRIRQFGEEPETTFVERVQDLPALLRAWADQLEAPPAEVQERLELPGFAGYALWAENYDQWENNVVIGGEQEVIWTLIGDVQGQRVLDVGCGTGRHALPLAASGAHVIGFDPAPEMLERARQKAQAQGLALDLREGSVETLDPALGQFDLVLCCLVLSHVADLHDAVVRLASFVRPGGRLVVSDFHPIQLLIGYRTSCVSGSQKYVVPNYLHLPCEYFQALASAGLTVTAFYEQGSTSRLPGLPMTLIMEAAKVRA